jgi:dethiobiotin synthetase
MVPEGNGAGDPGRPARLVLVVGTGTEVGKTWVSARLTEGIRAVGRVVAVRKPAQSFDPAADPGQHDAAVLARASGELPQRVCLPGRSYPVAMAPPMAAEVLGRPPFSIKDLVAELCWDGPDGQIAAVGLVEAAGGVCSPQAHDGDAAALAAALAPDLIILVADAGLGTINAVRSSAAALAPQAPLVVLNRFDAARDLHRRNRAWLAERDGLEVLTLPGQEEALVGRALN